jgi:hypothetical protein
MRNKSLISFVVLLVMAGSARAVDKTVDAMQARALELYSTAPMAFIENAGQIADPTVRYMFRGSGINIFHTTKGPVFQLFQREELAQDSKHLRDERAEHHGLVRYDKKDVIRRACSLSMRFIGAKEVRPIGRSKQETKVNYFIGNDPYKWHSDVATYSEVVYPELYDGISLYTFGRRSHLKYEFHVAAGADHRQIVVTYKGADDFQIDSNGALHINTPLSELVDGAPYVYQIINGRQVQISGRYRLIDENSYTFEISGRIDPTTELVIDPSLSWSCYLGGNDDETAYDIAVDRNSGDALLTGVTNSGYFGELYSWYYGTGGSYDAFVARIGSEGELLWVTYLGGVGDDEARGVAVDPNGDVLLAGRTASNNFPTEGELDQVLDGSTDAFVAKLSHDGSSLLWSRYLGGADDDLANDITIGATGDCLLTGATNSYPFPGSAFGFPQLHSGGTDAFVTKLSPRGEFGSTGWSSYLGGNQDDEGFGIAVDDFGNVLVTGRTDSNGIANADNSFGGNSDAFAAMWIDKPAGGGIRCTLAWLRYLGGSMSEGGYGIGAGMDTDGLYALLTGFTESSDFPACCGFDSSYCGWKEAFVARINYFNDSNDSSVAWASFLGGSVNDVGRGIAIVDQVNPEYEDYAVVTGDTNSYNFPTPGGFDPNYNGNYDAFVTTVTATGQLVWSSYLGGSDNDRGYGVAVDGEGSALVTGVTDSDDFPTRGGGDMEYNGGEDVFAAKIEMDEKVGLGKLYGTVWNPNGVPIGGAEVSVAGQMTLTDPKGQFSFDKDDNNPLTSDVFAGQTIVMVTKNTDYYPVTKIATIDVNSTTRVNIQMTEQIQSPGDAPYVVDIRAKYCGPSQQDPYYMKGPSVCEKFIATIDWGSYDPNRVEWYTRGREASSKPFYIDYLSAGTPITLVGVREISYHGRCFDMGGDDFGVGSGWVQVVAVGYKSDLGEASSVSKRVDFFDIIEAPPYVRDANDSNLVKVEFTGNGFEYKVLKVPDFNLAPWNGSGKGTGIPVFGGKNMNIGLDFKDEPKSCDSKLSASVSMDGTSFVFTKGCDGSTKREVHREVPVAGIELPELPGGVEVEAFATADFYLTHEEGLEPPWRTGGTLNLGCTFSFSTPEVPGPPVFGVPTYTRADLSLELGLSSSLEGWVGAGPDFSSHFYFEPLAKGILGAGVSDVACVEGYVGGGFHSEVLLYPEVRWGDTYIILVGGVEVIIGPFSSEVGLEYNWWFNPGAHTTITTSGFEVLPRDYLSSDAPLVLADNEDTIDSNVFPYSVPEVVRTDSGMLAVWIEDDINRDANDRTELRYATYDGIDWTLRGPVIDNLTADMNPQLVALPDNNAVCVWQDAKGTLAGCNDLRTLNSNLEVAVATYNGVSWIKKWSTDNSILDRSPKLAVDENDASKMLAVWISNQDSNMWGDSTAVNRIKWRNYSNVWDVADSTIDANFGMILGTALAYKDGIATYVFCRDGDNDLNTQGDQSLWNMTYSDSNNVWTTADWLTNDGNETSPRLIYDGDGNLLMFWVKGNDICMAKGNGNTITRNDVDQAEVVVTAGKSWGSKDFDLVMGDNGQIALIWSDISIPFYPKRLGPNHFDPNRIDPNVVDPYKDQHNLPAHTDTNDPNRILVSHDLWVSYHDPCFPQYWSRPRQLTWDDSAERFVSGAFEPNGTLLCVYNKRQTKYETVVYNDSNHHDVNIHNVPGPGRSDLVYLRDPLKCDLAIEIEDVMVIPPNPMPGTETKIYATVKNLGVSPVSDINVVFSDLSDPCGGAWSPGSIQMIEGPLVGGDACTVSVSWEVPVESASPRLVSVVIDPCKVQDDSNWNNNSINFKVLAPDLTISEMIVYNAEPNIIITARVANKGVLPAGVLPAYGMNNPVRVVLREGEPNGVIGQILAVHTIQSIEPMAYHDVQFILPPIQNDVNMGYAIVDEPIADPDNDAIVNLVDFSHFANNWLSYCGWPQWCGGADVNRDGRVNIFNEDNNIRGVRIR